MRTRPRCSVSIHRMNEACFGSRCSSQLFRNWTSGSKSHLIKTVVSAFLTSFVRISLEGGKLWPRAGFGSSYAPCHLNATSTSGPAAGFCRAQARGESSPHPRPWKDTKSEAGTEQRAHEKKLPGECDELPNLSEQKQISKPGTTARSLRSREMKRASQWAGGSWGGAEAFPCSRHERLALMCLQQQC